MEMFGVNKVNGYVKKSKRKYDDLPCMVPYEVFNKKYRNAQRVFDVEARQVASSASELEACKNQPVTTTEIESLLGGMVRSIVLRLISIGIPRFHPCID
ncbi:hypothetical protein O3G_MSEX013261 [Manduca sexta]|uniref:Uncharacterized protein n=1 Tax=Manduca sexta TaxID=7130 RepID=A0A921ZRA7_MANSE|nr:hypothetical protein O3G_MSEX013261 [Manduca sexta]